jgi:hypothetical protein
LESLHLSERPAKQTDETHRTREAKSPSEKNPTLTLVKQIRAKKDKKRRGRYNKNEALYNFIDQIHDSLAEESLVRSGEGKVSPRGDDYGDYRAFNNSYY